MALAILCGFLFGFAGLVFGGLVGDETHLSRHAVAAVGAMLGAIFGAIVGGTGAIVQAIGESTQPADPAVDRWRKRTSLIVLLVLVLILGIIFVVSRYIGGS